MNELISVVVPVYNVEKYLDKCVESILGQTYKKIEIILVDDGSTDNSGIKCDEWSKKDDRISVIHKKNGGLSDARNVGMNVANGEYIAFIDSDDFLDLEYLEKLYNFVVEEKADIGVCNPYYYYESSRIEKRYHIVRKKIVADALSMTIRLLYQKQYDTSAWGKIYKTKLFKENEIYYPKGKLYEDIATTYKVFLKANKIAFLNQELYYYRQRDNSIMRKEFNIREMDYIENAKMLLESVSSINKNIQKAAISRFVSANFAIYKKINDEEKYCDQIKYIQRNIKKYRRIVLFDIKSRIKNKIAVLFSYINLRLIKYF